MTEETASGLPLHLVEGYEVFLGGRFRSEEARFRSLAIKGQKPTTMVIGCCDSRVAPEAIFDAGPGELFVLRNVAASTSRVIRPSRTIEMAPSSSEMTTTIA